MNTKRRIALIWRWSLLTAGLIAVFWLVWHLITGSVPNSEIFTVDGVPFKISRWWDVPTGAVVVALIVLMITNIATESDGSGNQGAPADELRFWLAFGMFVGILGLALFTLTIGLASGLVLALLLGLPWLIFCLILGLFVGIIFELLFLVIKSLF